MRAIKTLEHSLVPFNSILERAIEGRGYRMFAKLTMMDDFVDGFQLHQGHCPDPQSLRAFLKSHHLECLPLRRKGGPGYYFGQQIAGPFTADFTLQALISTTEAMRSPTLNPHNSTDHALIGQVDIARDIRGTFYAQGAFRNKYRELKKELER